MLLVALLHRQKWNSIKHLKCFSHFLFFNFLLNFPSLSLASEAARHFHICLGSHYPMDVTMSLMVSTWTQYSHQPWGLDCTSGLARVIPCFPHTAGEMVGPMRPWPWDPTLSVISFSMIPGCHAADWLGDQSGKSWSSSNRPNCTQPDKQVWGTAHWDRISPVGDMGWLGYSLHCLPVLQDTTGFSAGQGFVRFPTLHSGLLVFTTWAQWCRYWVY